MGQSAPRPKKRWRFFGIVLVTLLVLIAFAPTIIAKTPLRDWLVNSAIADDEIVVSTQSASFGYFSPLEILGFRLKATSGTVQVEIDEIETEKSWLVMLFSRDDLGTFDFRKPIVECVTGISTTPTADANDQAPPSAKALPQLIANVDDAGVEVRDVGLQDPTIKLDGIDFTVRIVNAESESTIVIDPVTILDDQTLTPELCSRGVQLIAPMMADVVDVSGKISFELNRFSVPVGQMTEQERNQRLEIEGAIELADVEVGLTSRIAGELMPLLELIPGFNRPLKMTVNRSSEVRFQVVDGRVHHQGLMFLLPLQDKSFEVVSSGSVGIDESLDLTLVLRFPGVLLGDVPLARFLVKEPLAIHVGGTVSEPTVELGSSGSWVNQLQNLLSNSAGNKQDTAGSNGQSDPDPSAPSETDQTVESVLNVVEGLIGEAAQSDEPLLPGLRDRLRNRREQRSSGDRRRILPRLRRQRQPGSEPESTQEDAKPAPIEPTEV